MIDEEICPAEPWQVRETRLDTALLAPTESVFALANGYLGLRGNLDEGEPHEISGTYLSSYYEERPLPYPEGGYGYPEQGETVVNVTDGKIIRLTVDDEQFHVGRGVLHSHQRVLDLRTGLLRREVDWESPAGRRVRIRSERLVSFTQRAVAAIVYEVEAVDRQVRITLQSGLAANEEQVKVSDDPRVAAALEDPLEAVEQDTEQHGAVLLHRTRRSGLLMAAGMDHIVEAPAAYQEETDVREDWARTTVVTVLPPGGRLRLIKFVAYGWSTSRSTEALRDQVAAALNTARYVGWDGLAAEQRGYLDDFWDGADVEVDGDPALQQAVRFGLFHVLQAGARTERQAIPAKGLTGPGYDGHAFWDTEGHVLPLLAYTAPRAAADALRWRHTILPQARQRAGMLGLSGAAFPWRTIGGSECSAYWPAGTAALHLNAVVALAVDRYRRITGDTALEPECGLEILVETARLWVSHGHHDTAGRWHVDGVTGPDEYSAVADDNVFTNLMAARNLRAAADACARHPELAARLGVATDEPENWRACAKTVHIPYDESLGVHPQSEGFTRYAAWPFPDERADGPLMLRAPYFQLYRRQVCKQADLVLAMHWCPDAFTPEQKARNVDYYERITVRDSSLSACTQAVMCAEVGHLELAHDYAWEAAMVDLRDLHGNTRDGLHIASLAGAWSALVEGFGGLRECETGPAEIELAPRLPSGITRMRFNLRYRGRRLWVEADHQSTRVGLRDRDGGRLPILLYGDQVEVGMDEPVTRPVVRLDPLLPVPQQPPGYAPRRRGERP
ncbi:glycoside hydrolase family 65 protein [Actinoplanes derwentensis]|uniref:Trehalose and maltose hydrolase (Possible phosphorylase) n=1 Tax=Actinoplanes derwentensis TaxID=113562 RepID=A0A1H1TGE1_9ACTN|nr:glycosyl hydrolase family 65 protein [Actinoplanes derwentensis]GID85017.1 glycosyl hydrolase [Actinoplanes derwentensis]SDS59016.1 Trehalose and maltose hydrolase (possible phosphorylase) [Actinoplanes derwentensis]